MDIGPKFVFCRMTECCKIVIVVKKNGYISWNATE